MTKGFIAMMNGTASSRLRLASRDDLTAAWVEEQAGQRSPQPALDIVGHLDLCGPDLVEGWVFWRSCPDQALKLEVFIDGVCRGQCSAELFRADLQQAGFGAGNCAFRFVIARPAEVRDFATTRVRFANSVLHLLPDASTRLWQVRRAEAPALAAVGQ